MIWYVKIIIGIVLIIAISSLWLAPKWIEGRKKNETIQKKDKKTK